MKARPDRPDAAHQPVEQEGRARQVAAVLQQQDEEEQDQDLRQEHQHAADAGDQPSTSRLRSGAAGSAR